jgi:hypothetical protein
MSEANKLLTRDLILAAMDLPTKDVEVPEWGGTVRVRAMTGAERDLFETTLVADKGEDRKTKFINLRARFCSLVVVGEDSRTPLFTEKDMEALGKKSARALNRVFEAGRELSGFSDKDVKELEGN